MFRSEQVTCHPSETNGNLHHFVILQVRVTWLHSGQVSIFCPDLVSLRKRHIFCSVFARCPLVDDLSIPAMACVLTHFFGIVILNKELERLW
jgi:hypothetical protein